MNRITQSQLRTQAGKRTEAEQVLQRQRREPALQPAPRTWVRRIARGFTALFVAQTLLTLPLIPAPAYAQVTAAPGAQAGQKPLIDAAANGTPIVLIAPPSRAGVSRNLYDQFNVDKKGLILNNSAGHVQTRLGGWISRNLQLGQTPAKIILNEVTGANARAPAPIRTTPTRTSTASTSRPTATATPRGRALQTRARRTTSSLLAM